MKSHIFLAAYRAQADEDRKEDGTGKHPYFYSILIEPHEHHLPFYHGDANKSKDFMPPLKYETDFNGLLTRHPRSSDVADRIGKVMIGESGHSNAMRVDRILQQSVSSSTQELPPDGFEEKWLYLAIHALQKEKILNEFNIGELLTFTHAYLRERQEGEGPAAVVFPRLKDRERKKNQGKGFWISFPTAGRLRPYPDVGRLYGGLM